MGKLPAFQFYPADWRKDPGVQSLDYHDRGVWFEILCLMHESDERGVLLLNGSPMPDEALARILGLDKQILTTTLTSILNYGVASRRSGDGALMSRRMIRDEKLRQIRSEAGKLGGNPRLKEQNGTTQDKQNQTTGVKQKSTPSSSITITKESSADALRLSGILGEIILKNNPQHRELSNGNRDAAISRWAKDIEKLICIDQKHADEIERVIRFAQSDSFWIPNIQSGKKLREKYETLKMQMVQRRTGKTPSPGEIPEYKRRLT